MKMEGKIICLNRSATHEYFVLDRYEAGIVLDGGEVKSVRNGNCNITDGFCLFRGRELFLKNAHIAVYDKSGAFNVKDARRDRKLLLKKSEIVKLSAKTAEKGLTVVPLKMYFKDALIKVEIGLCQGKHVYDKKRTLMEKDIDREKERYLKSVK